MALSPTMYAIFFGVSVVAGLVDAITGGGGLIVMPTLLACGLPPAFALGTNKVGAVFGTFTAAQRYHRAGLLNLRSCVPGFVFTFIGAAFGAWTVQRIDNHFLEKFIPIMLGGILLYSIFKPDLGTADRAAKLTAPVFYTVFGLGLGFYDGFFGPGTGTFWALAFVMVLGQNFASATAHTKVMNFASGLASLILFISGGKVLYGAGLTLAAGQVIGAHLGSSIVVRRGARFVRPLFLSMAGIIVLKLLYNVLTHPK